MTLIHKLIRITTVPISLDKLLDRQMSFMKYYYNIIIISSDDAFLKKVGEKNGVNTFCVEMTRKITLLKDLRALWKLYIFFKKEKPFIVHTHTPKAGLLGMLAARLAKIPHRLHTVAGLPLMETVGLKRKVLFFTEKLTYKCANHVYPNSLGLYKFILKENLCPKCKMKIIGNGSSNGIDTKYFSPSFYSSEQRKKIKNNLNIHFNDIVFCFIGRIVKDKGINELVQAFIQINENYLHTKLLLVGSFERELNPLLPETEREINNHQNIISVGFQEDVRPYLAIADIFVFPSYREGFPNVVMQAGAMELPCIVTNINGCNEIIENGKNGLIVPSKDRIQLQEKMQFLLNDSNSRLKLKKNARLMITSRYEQIMFWEALLNEYKNLENN